MIPQPPKSTLFPYTTLFRSAMYLTKVTEQTIILPTGGGRWGPKRYPDIVAHLTEPPPAHFREVAVSRDARGNYYCSRSEEHTSELQSRRDLVCRLLLEKKKQ